MARTGAQCFCREKAEGRLVPSLEGRTWKSPTPFLMVQYRYQLLVPQQWALVVQVPLRGCEDQGESQAGSAHPHFFFLSLLGLSISAGKAVFR